MLASLSWLPFVLLLTPATHARADHVPPRALVHAAADSGTLLTTELLTPYAAVEKELNAYFVAHPDRKKGTQVQTSIQFNGNGRTSSQGGASDYSSAVQQDTAVAAIFTKHHFTPAQFAAVQNASYSAIRAVLNHRAVDSTAVTGKNVAFVQAHRPELAADWGQVQMVTNLVNSIFSRIQQGAKEQMQNRGQAQAPANTAGTSSP